MLNPIKPTKNDIEYELLDVARVFYLLSTTKTNDRPAIDSYFTDEGRGYLNALSSLSEKIQVVSKKDYDTLREEYIRIKKKLNKQNKNKFINKILNR